MVARHDPQGADPRFGVVAEGGVLQPCTEGPDRRIMGNAAEGDDRFEMREAADRGGEEAAAGVDLGADRLVSGRHASHRIGDGGADQLKAVIGARVEAVVGQTEFRQRRVEEVAGIVAGERPAGAVGPAHAGGEADDEQPHRIAAAGRQQGLDGGVVPGGFAGAQLFAVGDEARAERAVAAGFESFGRRNAR